LAVFPVMAGVPNAKDFLHVALVVVLASLILQGASIPWAARKTGVALPDEDDEASSRKVYGDFEVPANVPMRDLCAFYGWPLQHRHDSAVGDWLQEELGRPPIEGDHTTLANAELSVRAMKEGRISRVGIRLMEPPTEPAPEVSP
jgi:potassium/hydrogen antiporter